MKLYICFGTGGGDHHPCAHAYRSLTKAGYSPELKKVYGSGYLPKFLQSKGRKKLAERTGSYFMPVLELDDNSLISGSENIVKWAKNNKP